MLREHTVISCSKELIWVHRPWRAELVRLLGTSMEGRIAMMTDVFEVHSADLLVRMANTDRDWMIRPSRPPAE